MSRFPGVDYMEFDSLLTEEERLVRDTVREWVDDKVKPIGREGTAASHWVLIDFGSVIVHIFTPPERDYYGLEKHWSEARTILRVQ